MDAKPGIAAISYSAGNLSLLLGAGKGRFNSGQRVVFGAADSRRTLATDMNFDGKPDLIVADESKGDLIVMQGTGKGGFSSPTRFATRREPFWIASGDVNSDGFPDLLAAGGEYAVTKKLNTDSVTLVLNNCKLRR